MGIHKLMSLLNEKAPNSVRKLDLSAFAGRLVACVKIKILGCKYGYVLIFNINFRIF